MNNRNKLYLTKQEGAVLPVALFVLLLATLLSVSTMQTTTIDLKIAQNRQARVQTERAVERAIERIISDSDNFTAKNDVSGNPSLPDSQIMNMGTWSVTVQRPYCIDSAAAPGYSINAPLIPEHNVWIFESCATDGLTGARVVMEQGVRMLMLSGYCDYASFDAPDPCA